MKNITSSFGALALLGWAVGGNFALAAPAADGAQAAASPSAQYVNPLPGELGQINAALKTLLVQADPAVKAILDKYPKFDPLTVTPVAVKALPLNAEGNFIIGPNYANATELTYKDGVPKGKVYEFVMQAADSKIYPGTGVRGTAPRQVAVYVPSQYVPGTPAPVIVAQDGYLLHYNTMLPPILDNLIAQQRVPVMIAVMVNSGGGDGKGSERGLEYDTVSGLYTDFVETEVLPKIAKDYNLTFTKDPDGRATIGGSSGGAAAFAMAWFHPELYHRVITYSGTYVNNQSPVNPASPHGAWEFHEHLVPQSAPKPIRIWLEAGERDNGAASSEASMGNWIIANQHMAEALQAKGYHYQYAFALNAGHVDSNVVRQTLPEALEWVWEGYAAPAANTPAAAP